VGKRVGYAIGGFVGQVGKSIGDLNPFKTPGLKDIPKPVAPPPVVAPSIPAGIAAATANAPASYQGATIAPVTGPTAAQIDMTGANGFRADQQNLVNTLAGQVAGTGPSLAQHQLRVGQEAALAASIAQANSAKGGAQPAMARAALESNAEAQGKMAEQAAQLRIQEQMSAAGLLGQVTQGARESDIGLATNQAQFNQQVALDSYKGQLQTAIAQGQIDQQTASQMYDAKVQESMKNAELEQAFNQLRAQYEAMGLDAATANQNAAIKIQELKTSGVIAANNQTVQQDAAKKQLIGGLAGAAGSGAAAYATMA
jgi:hypothetical protein